VTKSGCISVESSAATVAIPLSAGWNLVSVSVSCENVTVPAEVAETAYAYDPAMRTYTAASLENLEPGRGYRALATADCTATVTPVA
jgi:hypothetical protein